MAECNCGKVTTESDEDVLQVLTGVGLGVWVHYFSFLPTGEPCREKGTPSG